MPSLFKPVAMTLLTVGATCLALADDSDFGSPFNIGVGAQFNVINHTWNPELNLQYPLCPRLALNGNTKTSASTLSVQPVALMAFGLSDVGNYINSVLSSAENGNNPGCRNLLVYSGLGLGMQFSAGSRNPISFTTGYLASFQANRVPHGAAYLGISFSFGGQ